MSNTAKFTDVTKHYSTCMTESDPQLGGCCCKCSNQVKVMSHPWYNGFPASHQLGWGCSVGDGEVMMISGQHTLCEMFKEADNE